MRPEDPAAQNVIINAKYRQGALAYRLAELTTTNPYRADSTASNHWTNGFLNEQRCLHVVDGADIISSGFEGRIDLQVASSIHLQPRKVYLG